MLHTEFNIFFIENKGCTIAFVRFLKGVLFVFIVCLQRVNLNGLIYTKHGIQKGASNTLNEFKYPFKHQKSNEYSE